MLGGVGQLVDLPAGQLASVLVESVEQLELGGTLQALELLNRNQSRERLAATLDDELVASLGDAIEKIAELLANVCSLDGLFHLRRANESAIADPGLQR